MTRTVNGTGHGERLSGRDAGRAGSDEQEYRAGEPHNPLILKLLLLFFFSPLNQRVAQLTILGVDSCANKA